MLRGYYWTDVTTMSLALRIELIDQTRTALSVGEKSDNKKLPYPDAYRVIITRNDQNGDLLSDYFQDDERVAQEIIYGHP